MEEFRDNSKPAKSHAVEIRAENLQGKVDADENLFSLKCTHTHACTGTHTCMHTHIHTRACTQRHTTHQKSLNSALKNLIFKILKQVSGLDGYI